MKKYDENWALDFIPECFFDTVILKRLLGTNKNVRHIKGCNNVINALKRKDLINSFAVAVIDKDKKEIDYYLKYCEKLRDGKGFILWRHENKIHFIIQINPPIEKRIINILNENGLNIEHFGYPNHFKKLKNAIKIDIDSENDEKLNRLVNAIINTESKIIIKLANVLKVLKDKKGTVDINELKNV